MNPNHLHPFYSSSSSSSDSDDELQQILIDSYITQNQILARWIYNNNFMASLLNRNSTNSHGRSSRRTVNQQRRRLISLGSRDSGQPHRRSSSSSGEEDGGAAWSGAVDSVTSSPTSMQLNTNGPPPSSGEEEAEKNRPKKIEHYQIKGQKMLENILDETIEVVTDTAHVQEKDPVQDDAGVRHFRSAPPGIVFDHLDELLGPKKKPRIVPGEELDEKSNEFREQLQCAATEGADRARGEGKKALAEVEAREGATGKKDT